MAERAQVSALVARWRSAGAHPEVYGAPVNPSPALTVAAHALAGLLGTGLGIFRPLLGLALLLAAMWSGWREAQGLEGWVSRLTPRALGHNVVLWGGRPLDGSPRPCLLLWAPLDGGRARRPLGTGLLSALGALGALCALGVLVGPFAREAGQNLATIGAAGLGLALLGALVLHLGWPWDGATGAAGERLERVTEALAARPPEHLDVVTVLSTGGASRADALETLLLNQRHRLGAARVLALEPALAGLRRVSEEGRWQRRKPDALLDEQASAAGLEAAARVTAATRAQALGFRALGLTIAADASPKPVLDVIAALDCAAGEGRW